MKGNLVRIINRSGVTPTGHAILNLSELEVYSSVDGLSVNLALGKTATMSSVLSDQWGPSFANDGKYPSTGVGFAHSNDTPTATPVWLMIDLRAEHDIDIIRAINRRDCCQERMVGFSFEILDSTQKVIYTSSDIGEVAMAYEVFPPDVKIYKTMANAKDQFYTNWSPWSACSLPCGSGVQKRARGLIPNAKGEMPTQPDALLETQACNTNKCATVFSDWSDWGACVAGLKERRRTIVQDVAGQLGSATPADLSETQACPIPTPVTPVTPPSTVTAVTPPDPSNFFGHTFSLGNADLKTIGVAVAAIILLICCICCCYRQREKFTI